MNVWPLKARKYFNAVNLFSCLFRHVVTISIQIYRLQINHCERMLLAVIVCRNKVYVKEETGLCATFSSRDSLSCSSDVSLASICLVLFELAKFIKYENLRIIH